MPIADEQENKLMSISIKDIWTKSMSFIKSEYTYIGNII